MALIKVTAKLTRTIFKDKAFSKSLIKTCEIQNRQATRAFLRAALEKIPTYTGTARGTFKPLGRLLRVAVPLVGPAGRSGDVKRAKKKKTISYRGRTFIAGFGAGANYGEYSLEVERGVNSIINTFTIDNKLPYVLRNNFFGEPPNFKLPSNPPWHWLEQGVDAWDKYLLEVGFKKFPSYISHLKLSPYTITRNS